MTPLAYQSQSHLQSGSSTTPHWDSKVSMNTLSKYSSHVHLCDLLPLGSKHMAVFIIGSLEVEGMTPQRGTYLSGHSHPHNPYCLALHEPC